MDQEMRDLIIRIDVRTEAMAKSFDEKMAVVDKRLDSHAGEIKDLGRWRFYLMGLGSAVTAWIKMSR